MGDMGHHGLLAYVKKITPIIKNMKFDKGNNNRGGDRRGGERRGGGDRGGRPNRGPRNER